jgi:hypothetical protein
MENQKVIINKAPILCNFISVSVIASADSWIDFSMCDRGH